AATAGSPVDQPAPKAASGDGIARARAAAGGTAMSTAGTTKQAFITGPGLSVRPHQHQLSGISSISTLNHKACPRWMQLCQSLDAPLRATSQRSLMTRWPFLPQADTAKKQSLMRA